MIILIQSLLEYRHSNGKKHNQKAWKLQKFVGNIIFNMSTEVIRNRENDSLWEISWIVDHKIVICFQTEWYHHLMFNN